MLQNMFLCLTEFNYVRCVRMVHEELYVPWQMGHAKTHNCNAHVLDHSHHCSINSIEVCCRRLELITSTILQTGTQERRVWTR